VAAGIELILAIIPSSVGSKKTGIAEVGGKDEEDEGAVVLCGITTFWAS
jgi:hypothetical protein